MRISAIFALAAFPFLLAAQQPAQPDWRFAHADATLVGAIRLQQLLNSPLLTEALAQAPKQDANTAAMIGMARAALSGITEIRFSLLDNGTSEPDVIAVVSGRFDDSLIAMMSQGKVAARRIDPNTLLLGNGQALEQAALRMTETAAKLQPRALAGTEVLAAYDLWISGKLPDLPMAAALQLSLRGLALGLSLHDNIEMQLAMDAATPAQAEALIKSAHEAEASQPVQYRGMLQSFVEGTTARFRLNVPRATAIEAMRTRVPAPLPMTASNTPQPLEAPPAAPPPPRTRPQTVVIQGLDGGPREVPLQ